MADKVITIFDQKKYTIEKKGEDLIVCDLATGECSTYTPLMFLYSMWLHKFMYEGYEV